VIFLVAFALLTLQILAEVIKAVGRYRTPRAG
jgi:TRAP-type mannitol/chloroaromatic compound transport system permease small subunit